MGAKIGSYVTDVDHGQHRTDLTYARPTHYWTIIINDSTELATPRAVTIVRGRGVESINGRWLFRFSIAATCYIPL